MFRCRVTLLDDTHIERNLEKGAVGQALFDKVCEHLNLLERDYFGLAVWYTPTTKVWLDFSKEVSKQIIGHDATLTFNVKFYPPDPSVLAEDITRYLLCLQLRIDILTCRLSCPLDVLAELGSFAVQSEFGEYDSEKHGQGYLSNTAFTPHQTPELLDTITELHRSYKSMSPAQADKFFLQKAKNLPMYGVDLHLAMDNNRGDVMLGVCAEGLNVYEDETQTDNLPWPKILKMSYKRNRIILQILQEEDASENTVIFKLPNYRACKSLWKTALEHHAFFRNHRKDRSFPNLLHLGSKFRFHGNTHTECLEASSNINRPPLHVARSAIKRKTKESMLQTLKRPNRTELDDWFQVLEKLQPSFGLEMYKADESSLVYRTTETKTYRHTHKVTWTHVKGHSYEEGEEGQEPEGEEPQLPSGQTFPLSVSFSSDTNILKSAVSQSCKQQVDDWFDILNPQASKSSSWILETALWAKREVANQRGGIQQREGEPLHRLHTLLPQHTEDDWHVLLDLPSWSPQQTPSASFQSSQPLEQRQELEKNEWEEKPSEDSVKVVKIMKEVQYMTEGSEIGAIDIAGDSLKMGIGEKQSLMKDIEERLQQEDGQPRDVFAEQNTKRLEIVNRKQGFLVAGGQVISVLTIEELDKNILKGENTEQRLQDIEGVKVRLEEREILEKKLQQAQQEQGEQRQQDDWHILIEPRPLAAGAKREVGALQRGGIQQPLHRLHTLLPQHTEDDWHVLLDLPSWSPQQTPSASFQSSQPLEQRQELEKNEWEEKPSEDSVKVVKIMKEVQYTEGSEGLEVQTRQESADITGDSLKMGIGETIMKIREEKLEEQGDGVRFQNVIMYQQRTQEIQSYDEQPRDIFVQGILKIVERKQDLLVVGGQVASEETIEELENKLREVESIEQKLQDIEGLKVRLREVEILEQKLQQAEQKQGEQRQQDDWHILMDCRPHAAGAKTEVALQRGRIQRWEGEPLHKLHTLLPQNTEDDWHVLLDLPPRSQQEPPSDRTVVSIVTEGRKWDEESIWKEERRENQVTESLHVKESRQPIITGQSVQTRMDIIDDWFVQLNLTPKLSVTAPPMTVTVTDEDIMAQTNMAKEERRRQVVVVEKPESRILLHQKRAAPPQREGHDDWFILLHASPLETVPVTGLYEERVSVKTQRVTIVSEHMSMKGRGVTIDEKPTVIREKLSKVREVEKTPAALREIDDNWFVLFDWTPFERRGVAAVEESDARPSQERRVREVQERRAREAQERRIRDEEPRKQKACALLKSMPEPPRDGVDDWFVLLETPPKGDVSYPPRVPWPVGADRRGPEDQSWKEEEKKRVLKEEQKKRVMEEERKKRMMEDWRKGTTVQERRAAQPPWEEKDNWFTLLSVSPKQPVPVISPVPVAVPKARPLPPADQPLTSTPTTQPAPITRPTYQEERTKRLDITQESEVEIESVLRRQRKAKRIEGETIFIRHSILMLEDFDVTPEVVIRHHASIRELKRIFLEDMPVYGPTEWDKRLSTHSPVKIPKLTNGDLFLGMEIMADGISVI